MSAKRHPYRHLWIGTGAGQAGESGTEYCFCAGGGEVKAKRRGYDTRGRWYEDRTWRTLTDPEAIAFVERHYYGA
jgi:hypothetical protein